MSWGAYPADAGRKVPYLPLWGCLSGVSRPMGSTRSFEKPWALWTYDQAMDNWTILVKLLDGIDLHEEEILGVTMVIGDLRPSYFPFDMFHLRMQRTCKRMEGLVLTVQDESSHRFSIHRVKLHRVLCYTFNCSNQINQVTADDWPSEVRMDHRLRWAVSHRWFCLWILYSFKLCLCNSEK